MILGLTGLYCAGKNHVGLLLEKRGFPVLDADALGHEAILGKAEEIIGRFGEEIVRSDGLIDRRLLSRIVFGKPEKLAVLEGIIHPVVNRLIEKWITSHAGPCVINAALLHKSAVFNQLNAIIAVNAPFPVRFFRAVNRDRLPWNELIQRFLSQKSFPRYNSGRSQFFPCAADIYTIQNSGFPLSGRTLEKRIDGILEGVSHGKEKTITGNSFGRSISGNRI